MVSIPPAFSLSGKRERYFFETKADARIHSEEETIRIKNFGGAGNGLTSPAENEQAKHALESLRTYKTPLNHVVRDWIARKQAQETTVTFALAAAEYRSWLEKRLIKGHLTLVPEYIRALDQLQSLLHEVVLRNPQKVR